MEGIKADTALGTDCVGERKRLRSTIEEVCLETVERLDRQPDAADWTSVTSPPVTVVRQPVYRLGETAAKLLIERLNGYEASARRVVLQTELIERASVADAPA